MKANAKDIVVQCYNLVVSDETLAFWREENNGILLSDRKLRAKLLKEHVKGLIGDTGAKDSYFIYGRGTVRHSICVLFTPYNYLTVVTI